MRRVCAPPRTDPLTHQHDLDCDFACVLRKLSRDSQRSFSSLSFWHYFQVLVQNFLRLRRASGELSLTRLGPGSSPGRAESQLASELGELPLLGSQRVAVQQLPCPTAAATGTAAQGTGTGNAAGEQQVQPAGATSTSAALSPPWRQQPRTMPPPLCRRRRCRLCCCCRSVCRLSLVCTHTLKNCVTNLKCPDTGRGGRSWPA